MTRREALSWTPIARGAVYCSPACGRGCTREEHDRARSAAAELVESLGPGFKPEVWENLGWHYCARSGAVAVYPGLSFGATYDNRLWERRPTARGALRSLLRALDRQTREAERASAAVRLALAGGGR